MIHFITQFILVLLPSMGLAIINVYVHKYGSLGNYISIPSIIFAIIIPLLIQLGIKGSSIPVFLERYKKWDKMKYSIIIYRNALFISIFLPLMLVILSITHGLNSGNEGADNLGQLFFSAIITTLYLCHILLMLNIYSIIKHVKNEDSIFVYSHFSIMIFFIASFFMINALLLIIIKALDIDFNVYNHILDSFRNIFSDSNLVNNIAIVVSVALFISIAYTVANKFFKIIDYISLSNIILMNLPLYVILYIIHGHIGMYSTFGGKDFGFNFFTVSVNTLQFSYRFIIGFIIVLIFQKLNETGKITIEKFEFIDKSIKNKIFSISLVFFFFLGLLYMVFIEGSIVPMNFILLATFISIVPVYISRQKNKIDYLVQDRVRTLKRAKEHTEKILFNVFPKSVAVELNEKGSVLPKGFANVTLLFSDFKNFTNTSSTMSPEKLVGELNELFHSFDNVIEESGVEKIKTIGDAYMVASGVPNYESSHAEKCIETGLKMIEVLEERNISTGIKWDMRIGIHSGSVVAGLVGKSRFTYDLWGDTVNIASRMESSSEPGRINISGITYDLVKDIYDFDYRGKVDVKGKGEIDMYFVNKRLDN